MNYFFSIFAGIIQGLTEFLPISSSGHLIFLHEIFGFNFIDNLAFDVVLHLGTMVAVISFFCTDLFKYLRAWLQSLIKPDLKNNKDQLLAWLVLVAALPAGIVGLLAEDQIETFFRNPLLVAVLMILVGFILFFSDRFAALSKKLSQLNFFDSLVIGFSQIFALMPGVSRSGITIIAGLGQKLNRRDAAYFSFLVSSPLILGAGLKKTLDLMQMNLSHTDLFELLLGFIFSAITGYLCIKYFLKYLEKNSLQIFALYRIVLGTLVIIYLILI